MHPRKHRLAKTPLLSRLAQSIREYCSDIKQIDDELWFSFNSVRMHLSADAFTMNATIVAEVFDFNNHENEESPEEFYAGCDLANTMNRNMYPYTFVWEEIDRTIEARKNFTICLWRGLDFLIKVEIYRMYYLCQQVEKVYYMSQVSDFPDDESWMQFLLSVVDKWVAADLLDINILYLHGFASSGNSGTAREIRESLPHCTVISPDLPINPAEAFDIIRNNESNNCIDLVIGTSMGGLFALFCIGRNTIVVNPSFHVSQMMKRRLDGADSVTIPFYKKRETGETEFELTQSIANSYFNLESNVFLQSQLDMANVLGIFGTDDDVVNCKDEFLTHSLNIRYFKGGYRLTKEAVEEVVIPSILQVIINERMK